MPFDVPARHFCAVAALGEDEVPRVFGGRLEERRVDVDVGLEEGGDDHLLLPEGQHLDVLPEGMDHAVDVPVVRMDRVLLYVRLYVYRLPEEEVGYIYVPDSLDVVGRTGHSDDIAVRALDLLSALERYGEDVGGAIEVLEQGEPSADLPARQYVRVLLDPQLPVHPDFPRDLTVVARCLSEDHEVHVGAAAVGADLPVVDRPLQSRHRERGFEVARLLRFHSVESTHRLVVSVKHLVRIGDVRGGPRHRRERTDKRQSDQNPSLHPFLPRVGGSRACTRTSRSPHPRRRCRRPLSSG